MVVLKFPRKVLLILEKERSSLCSDKHLNLLIPAHFWPKFPSTVITACKSFMPFFLFVKQACKISHKSWNIQVFFPVFPQHPVPCADHHGFVSARDHKLQRPWYRLGESASPYHLT